MFSAITRAHIEGAGKGVTSRVYRMNLRSDVSRRHIKFDAFFVTECRNTAETARVLHWQNSETRACYIRHLFLCLATGHPACLWPQFAFIICGCVDQKDKRASRRDGTETKGRIFVSAFVLSRLGYRNSLLFGCLQYLLSKLQKVQNTAARLVVRVPKADRIFSHLASLHWPSTDSRIQYKLATLCYNCLSSTAAGYLTELKVDKPTRKIRSSSDASIFCLSSVRTHSLVRDLFLSMLRHLSGTVFLAKLGQSPNTFTSLKSSSKSHLFRLSYWLCLCARARVCYDCILVLCFVMGCAPLWRNRT